MRAWFLVSVACVACTKPAPPVSPDLGVPFAPTTSLRGKPSASTIGATFTIPEAWRETSDETRAGEPLVQLSPAGASFGVGIAIVRRSANGASITQLLTDQARKIFVSGYTIVLGPEALRVNQQRAGRLIVRGTIDGEIMQTMEAYVAAVRAGDLSFVLWGVYNEGDGVELRPAVETVLGSFKISAAGR